MERISRDSGGRITSNGLFYNAPPTTFSPFSDRPMVAQVGVAGRRKVLPTVPTQGAATSWWKKMEEQAAASGALAGGMVAAEEGRLGSGARFPVARLRPKDAESLSCIR